MNCLVIGYFGYKFHSGNLIVELRNTVILWLFWLPFNKGTDISSTRSSFFVSILQVEPI